MGFAVELEQGAGREAAQLDDSECDRIVDIVRAQMPAGRPLIAGTGRESTRATIAATRRAAAAGVDAVLVRTPSFFKSQMTTDVFVRHYTEVADASPVPVLLYNVSMFTGVNLQPDAVERLAVHPNIVGIKESGSDIAQIAELVGRTPEDFTVLAGSATTFVHALCAGCDGAILALVQAFTERRWPIPLAIGLYLLVSIGGGVYASLLQRIVVSPNEQARETPYIQHNIEATRTAFALAGIEERPISGEARLTRADIDRNTATLQNVRLWDHGPLLDTFSQLQEIRTYYDFVAIDNDRYTIDGSLRQVMLSGREINTTSLPNRSSPICDRSMSYSTVFRLMRRCISSLAGTPKRAKCREPPTKGSWTPKQR